VYPRQNISLYNRILEKGLLISENPLGTKPEGFRFPARNRIISGMAYGVLVVEAAQKSGSLITARMALDEGREVFAVPGRVDSFKSTGTHKLLQDGAKLVHSVDDILDEYAFESPHQKQSSRDNPHHKLDVKAATSEENIIIGALDAYPQEVDSIIRKSALPASKVNEILLLLELQGRIERQPGHTFSLKT
jgi:DNA processing protein